MHYRHLAIALLAVPLALTSGARGATVFDADFNSATPGQGADAATTIALLNSGTAVGSWSNIANGNFGSEGPRISTNGLGENGAIPGIGLYERAAVFTSDALLADGVSVSMDVATIHGHNDDTNNRNNYIVGLDSIGQEVFFILVEGVNNANKLTYHVAGENDDNNAVFIGGIGRDGSEASYAPNVMTNFRLELSSSSFDIFFDGALAATIGSVAYRTNGVSNLAEIRFSGNQGRSNFWLDNVLVESETGGGNGGGEIPAPAALPAGLAMIACLAARRRRH